MKETYARSLRHLFGALLLSGATVAALAAAPGNRATVAGVDIYYGMVPAQLAAKHPLSHEERTMHGGVKGAKDAYHLLVALFDAKGERAGIPGVGNRQGRAGQHRDEQPSSKAGKHDVGLLGDCRRPYGERGYATSARREVSCQKNARARGTHCSAGCRTSLTTRSRSVTLPPRNPEVPISSA